MLSLGAALDVGVGEEAIDCPLHCSKTRLILATASFLSV